MTLCQSLFFVPITLLVATSGSYAGGIETLTLSRGTVYVDEEVTVTVDAGSTPPEYCGMVLHYGDGSESQNVKIDGNGARFPLQVRRVFKSPGKFLIKAEGLKVTSHWPCLGNAETMLTVIAKPPPSEPGSMVRSSSEPSQPTPVLGAKPLPAPKRKPAPVTAQPKPVTQQPERPAPKFSPIGGGTSASDL
jgi:hypothetical protein